MRPAGHHRRTGVPQPERAAHAADPGDGRDPVPVPGRPGAGGKREPTLSAPAVAGDPGAIRVSVDQLVVQAFDQMMEAEQFSVGWDAGKGVGMM